ncbi:MAG: hypothetical protein AOA66_1076 [Candidatus Bathyarchaeota archaeon BA2]|nr:MAG: hypothetical protein AOA66_1076 [Candidatus Bathyarchaeota archaeon BA2]
MTKKCEICGEEWGGILGKGFYRCRICRRLVCSDCYNAEKGVCSYCEERLK